MKCTSTISLLFLSAAVAFPFERDNNTASINSTNTPVTVEPIFGANGLLNITNALNGIIFGDFGVQSNALRFNGSLAVQGNFSAIGMNINDDRAAINCVANNGSLNLTDYGLIVEGQVVAQNVTVNGAVYADHTTHEGINFIDNNCSNFSTMSPPIDFEALKNTAYNISQHFASRKPNMVIRDGGYISDGKFQGDNDRDYYIFTFGLCKESPCVLPNYLYSSLEQIFLGGNWTGPWNSGYPLDRPIIFNIPILTDTVFNMSTANPAAGLDQAQVLYNVYPVDKNGAYNSTGHFVWLRNTAEVVSGHILAPSAFVVENNKDGFHGQLIAARYLSIENLLGEIPVPSNKSLPL